MPETIFIKMEKNMILNVTIQWSLYLEEPIVRFKVDMKLSMSSNIEIQFSLKSLGYGDFN